MNKTGYPTRKLRHNRKRPSKIQHALDHIFQNPKGMLFHRPLCGDLERIRDDKEESTPTHLISTDIIIPKHQHQEPITLHLHKKKNGTNGEELEDLFQEPSSC